ncbi:translation initiation factor eIF-1A [Methanosalsum natronophilum]|uniref:Translation initiation factor 1A n=1 Tax=Methanosalsum natronophilum TaxID=768733 RepID=A0A3R7VU98_9EURY|nr:translation initiation factor eIF-1A [Methanosalsum natronophilum]RQD85796.1 MAG: translation initiation factor eIF-1A [Methanosalsum natronophilum]
MDHKNNKKNSTGDEPQVTRVRIPKKSENEVLAIVETLLGANRLKLRCLDGVVRMGRIPGSMKKRTWIREGDIVIAVPWNFQDSKADVIWKYTRPQVDWLERKGFLKG